jgi:hypothetical protein
MSPPESIRDWSKELEAALASEEKANQQVRTIYGSEEDAQRTAIWDDAARTALRNLFRARRQRSEVEQIIERRRANGGGL